MNSPATAHTRLRDHDGRLRPVQATRSTRRQAERTLVQPAFKDYALREISIMTVDRFLKKLAKESLSKAQHARLRCRAGR